MSLCYCLYAECSKAGKCLNKVSPEERAKWVDPDKPLITFTASKPIERTPGKETVDPRDEEIQMLRKSNDRLKRKLGIEGTTEKELDEIMSDPVFDDDSRPTDESSVDRKYARKVLDRIQMSQRAADGAEDQVDIILDALKRATDKASVPRSKQERLAQRLINIWGKKAGLRRSN
jgi:hypothetical protein